MTNFRDANDHPCLSRNINALQKQIAPGLLFRFLCDGGLDQK